LGCLVSTPPCLADDDGLRRQVETLVEQNAELKRELDALRSEVSEVRDEALAARDSADRQAREAREAATRSPVSEAAAETDAEGAIFSRQVGRANFQLLDLSLDTLFAAGFSSANDDELEVLQGGGHDPRQRGFTLQQVELSLLGAVDPYMTGEAHLVYFLDTEGESQFEIEEAFLTTQMLPLHLEEMGVQVQAGAFFTEFGRINPQHPHAWDWQDQPVILSRLFGEDGMRGPGVRLSWLTPLPWYSELHFGMQNAKGETMVSFLANDEVFEERPIAGRPFADTRVTGLGDFVYLTRWVNGFDVSDSVSAQVGASALFGPNATGSDGSTIIAGGDLVVKWRPLQTDRGWPFVTWQTEFLYRDYRADDFFGCVDGEEECDAPVFVDGSDVDDYGLYTQLLWGFRRGWAAGVRYEYASGSGQDFDAEGLDFVSHNRDGFRDTRHRVSPLLVFQPSEFSRLRLQYNYDHVQHLSDESVHSAWAGVEFMFGAHSAHSY